MVYNNRKCYSTTKKLCFFGYMGWQGLKKVSEQQSIYVGYTHLPLGIKKKKKFWKWPDNTVQYCSKTLQHSPGYNQHCAIMLPAKV